MSLPSGYCNITSYANNCPISRHPVEDRSLMPKQIYGLLPDYDGSAILMVDNDGTFTMQAHGASLGAINSLVYAFILDSPLVESWILAPQPQYGNNVYTIKSSQSGLGWVISDEPGPRGYSINIGPIDNTPKNSLFTIVPIEDD
ncbi:hypothetical protein FRB96_007039 [Tulasnella sp. 330]|nr:hypothetical protein FRB96_007039 [Tulasnella sp. 330]KAG8873186.1 hypothetical protein FRB97_006981 [Tulasnella sp. 331]